jgi:hypothetical protein
VKNAKLGSLCSLLAVALCGCAAMDESVRVPGWPELKVVEHELPFSEVYRACHPYIGPLEAPLACTVYYLDDGEAHIYVVKGLKFGPIIEHERLHAAGYDHVGSSNLRDLLARWRAAKAAEEQARKQTADKPAASRPQILFPEKLARRKPVDW